MPKSMYTVVDVLKAHGYPFKLISKIEASAEPIKNLPCPVIAHQNQGGWNGPAMVYPPKSDDLGSLVCANCGESWGAKSLKEALSVSDAAIEERRDATVLPMPRTPDGTKHRATEVELINVANHWTEMQANAQKPKYAPHLLKYFMHRWGDEEVARAALHDVGWASRRHSVLLKSHPLIVPLYNENGVCASLVRRAIGPVDKPKSLRIPNAACGVASGTPLWFGDKPSLFASPLTDHTLWIAEGEIDTLMLMALRRMGRLQGGVMGMPGGIANNIKWWSATENLFAVLPHHIVVCVHNDEAGDKYWLKARQTFPTAKRANLPVKRDLTDICVEDGLGAAMTILMAGKAQYERFFRLDNSKWVYYAGGRWNVGTGKEGLRSRLLSEGIGGDEAKQRAFNLPAATGFIFNPASPSRVVVHDSNIYLNEYTGMPLQPAEGEWEDIATLLRHVVDYDKEAFEYVLDWLAAPLQNLHQWKGSKRNKTAIVFYGIQGTGKGLLFGPDGVMRALYGDANMVEINQYNLADSFTHSRLEKCLFISANEVSSGGVRDAKTLERLKMWITEPKLSVRAMRRASEEADVHFNMIFMSNDSQPVRLEPGDRRYSAFLQRSPILATDRDLVHRLIKSRDAGWPEAAAFLRHLLSRVVKRDLAVPMANKHRRRLLNLGQPSHVVFVEQLKELGLEGIAYDWAEDKDKGSFGDSVKYWTADGFVPKTYLFEIYARWCRSLGIRWQKNRHELYEEVLDQVEGARPTQRKMPAIGSRRGIAGIPLTPSGILEETRSIENFLN